MPKLNDDDIHTLRSAITDITRNIPALLAIACKQATPDTGDDVHVHATPTNAPTPIRFDAWQAYVDTEKLIRRAGYACGYAAATDPHTTITRIAKAILKRPVIAVRCDEHHGDPDTWLSDFLDMRRRVDSIVNPPKPNILYGVCPVCRCDVWGDPDGDIGVCKACLTRVPRSLAVNPLGALLAKADVRGTAKSLSATLATAGIRIPASTIRSWAHRGVIKADEDGTYSLQDILSIGRRNHGVD